MLYSLFEEWIRKLERKCRVLRAYSDQALADQYQEFKDIPGEAWVEICKRWWWQEQKMPTPSDLMSDWRQWWDSHGEKRARTSQEEDRGNRWCPDCLGYGGFTVRNAGGATVDGTPIPAGYETFLFCERCQQEMTWKVSGDRKVTLRRVSLAELRRLGAEILSPRWFEYEADGAGTTVANVREREPTKRGAAHIADVLPEISETEPF